MKKILSYLKPHILYMNFGLLIKFIGTIMDLALPWILSYIIDDVVPKADKLQIYFWGGMMIICSVIAIIGNIAANRMAGKVARDTTEKIRHDLFEKICYLSCGQTDSFTIPSLISRLTSDTYNIHQLIGAMQRLGVRAPILLIGGICVTLMMEPYLTLVLICILPLLAAVVYIVSKKGIPLYTNVQFAVDGIVRKVQENMTGVRVIKALSKSEYERHSFDEANTLAVKRDQKAGMVMSVTNPVMNLLLNVGLTAVVILGAFRVNSGLTQPGKIIAFLSYFTIILNAMMMVTRIFVMFSKGAASAKRIAEVLDQGEDMELLKSGQAAADGGYHVEFRDVNFSYNKVENNISGLSFGLMRGETLGIIGATGSGKTTVINLLMRFYDPGHADSSLDNDSGRGNIYIGGRDLRSIPDEELHTKFGVVFQNDFLLADTITENIRFGRDIPDEEIKRAAEAAQAAEFIGQKEEGYGYMLTVGGANLSGGQKQRLLIARALAGNPEILILDDSSSALDYKTDANLRRALHVSYAATTKIIVAQRISSIKNADKIIMLDDGKVIGSGTHDELMLSCASYREIAETQMGACLDE